MKTFYLLVAVASSFLLGRLSVDHLSPLPIPEDTELFTKQPISVTDVGHTDLERTKRELEMEITRLKNQLSQQHLSNSYDQVAPTTEIKTEDTAITSQAFVDAQEFSNKLITADNNFFPHLREKFNQEPIDQSWAIQRQQQIDQWIKNTKELESFSADDTVCRSTTCRITFPVRSAEASDELTQAFAKITQQPSSIIKGAIIYDHSIPGSLCLYIARNQQTKLYE